MRCVSIGAGVAQRGVGGLSTSQRVNGGRFMKRTTFTFARTNDAKRRSPQHRRIGCADAGPAATPLTITTTPGGATVTVDGVGVGNSPVTVQVRPGPHRLRASMSGYYPAPETKIVVERGTAATHALSLVPSH